MDTQAPRAKSSTVRWTTLATSFGFALVQLDVTIVNVALPRIGESLRNGTAGLQWVVDAYALVFAALLLTAGYLGDRFGARKVYLGGLALFALASLACGLAPGAAALIAGRILQGVGAAAMLPASLTLLNHAAGHDAKLRAQAVGWWTAAGSITIAAGPVVGGLVLAVASWRMIFLVNLPVCLLGAVLTLRVPETERRPGGRGFDVLGQILGIVALAALVGAVTEAKPLGIGDPRVLALFAAGVAAGLGFVVAESRVAAPMLPLKLFRAPGFAVCVVYGMVANLTYYGIVFVLSLYLQQGLGYSPAKAGLAFLPLTATFFVVNVASGTLVGRFGSRLPMVGGALCDALGFALLLTLGAHSAFAALVVPFVLMPAGMGTGVPAMTTAVLAGVDKALSGVASATLNAARQAGGAMGVALFGALAGEGHVVAGLHASAMSAVALLVAIAIAAAILVPRRR
ncbi:MFS transporter, DHA2 family, methylenomycin A resistance protein [Beijerinckiaceae bacterium RH AL1]|nr:MFS transporter [Beijerinckiaceae bacterium]VVB43168.1 MFS transporter, DHA2 family, methylenomycin A resistance protein [Beijerinckiaceae bacterium RH AL8]VVB43183.1 MFS transporter, DHA2 family, methylenomycin A resistance protein [Beijerinckiaceae bacterium RH CH11]VVC53704.1 MFS transporter, DHA2 family, methylenomycin A resistance protein [Beijerinckiaceae bacterium RH AL1]